MHPCIGTPRAISKVPYNLRKLFEMVDECCDAACDPVDFAAEFHHRLMSVYPFRRNPGTACRLFTNLLLLSRGYPPAIVLAHQRDAYYNALAHPDSTRLARIFGDAVELLLERARIRALRGELEEARRCCEEAFRLSIELEWADGVQHAQDALMRLGEVVNEPDGQADSM